MSTAILLEHMHKKFEINRTEIDGGCQSGRKVVTHNSKSDLPLGALAENSLILPMNSEFNRLAATKKIFLESVTFEFCHFLF